MIKKQDEKWEKIKYKFFLKKNQREIEIYPAKGGILSEFYFFNKQILLPVIGHSLQTSSLTPPTSVGFLRV
jgi:hypothetical protein